MKQYKQGMEEVQFIDIIIEIIICHTNINNIN